MKHRTYGKTFSTRLAQSLESAALIFVLAAVLLLAGGALHASGWIIPTDYGLLKVRLQAENMLSSAGVVLIGVALLALVVRIPVTKRFNLICSACALALLAGFGAVWAASVKAHAESDGDVLIQIAERIIAGDYAQIANSGEYFHYYLVRFPYQCGLLAFIEVFVRIFGATGMLPLVRLLNVALLVSSYAALLLITDRLFHDQRITFVTLLLLCAAIQPLFSCTFVYGLIPAFSLSVWAVYFVIRYVQDGKKRNMIPAALLFVIAALLRSNTWIAIVAVGIVLALTALKRRKIMPLVMLALIVALALPLPKLAQRSYEQQLSTSFGTGYPKSYWMAMSLQQGWKSTGWHVQDYQLMMQDEYGEDMHAIDARAKADIQRGVSALLEKPVDLMEYVFRKTASQWSEPTMMSIWITKSVPHYAEPNALARAVYSDAFDAAYRFAMKKVLLVLYAGAALGAGFLLRRGGSERLILPLIVLGGILFHLFFEAKSQYAIEYIPLFCPLAAYGVFSFGAGIMRRKATEQPDEPVRETPEQDKDA